MKRTLTLVAAVGALLLSGVAVANAAEPASCGAALSVLADVRAAAVAPAAELVAAKDAQVILAKTLVDAQAALDAYVAPSAANPVVLKSLSELTSDRNAAKAAADKGQERVTKATDANAVTVAAVVAAELDVTALCTGAPGTNAPVPTVAPTNSPVPLPVVVTQQVPVYPTVAPATGGGPAL